MTMPAPPIVDPIVVEQRVSAGAAEIDLVVPRDLYFFRGHFPGAPVVPGVVQIKWAVGFARKCLGVELGFAAMENVKFQRVMTPGLHVTLALEHVAVTRKLRFSFASDDTRYSSGRIVLRSAA